MSSQSAKDHWTQEAYSASASFVPELATKVVSWLDPQADDRILDLGCGDGILTAQIAACSAATTGLDASPNLIEAARKAHGSSSGLTWHLQDCRYLEDCADIEAGAYTKIFSNAALHWILRDPSTRLAVLRGALRALKPGGKLAFEMGGAGNVAEVHAALLAAVVHQHASIEEAREAIPWFFPSEELMRKMLQDVGFEVEKSELEYRPTRLTMEKEAGIEGWTRLMGAQILDVVPKGEQREAAVREVCDVLKTILTHEEDGGMWLGYVRLRILARKP